jgi:hypothetical protein
LDISSKIASFSFSERLAALLLPLFLEPPEAVEVDIFLRFAVLSSSPDSGLERAERLGACFPAALAVALTMVEKRRKEKGREDRWLDEYGKEKH